MIKIARTATPPILTNNKGTWDAAYRTALNNHIAAKTPASKKALVTAENKYRHVTVQRALKDMFNSKCAYCEAHITHIAYPHIEHFRPKSKFPAHCFNWNNLLLGCAICNGAEFKGNQFPSQAQGGPLIDPTAEAIGKFLTFTYDPKTGVASINHKNTRGKKSIEVYGLDRLDLVRHRNQVVRKMAFIALQASRGDNGALLEMRHYIKPDQEYSAFAIALFRKFKLRKK